MSTVVAKLPQRSQIKPSRQEGILHADLDNAYYQRMEMLINSSGALHRCVDTMAKYITGHGYADKAIGDLIINRQGWTFNRLHQKRCLDLVKTGGFAIHVNYNALYEPVELQFVPFKYCRLAINKDEELTGQIAVYEDWGNIRWSKTKKDKIKLIDLFNPDPERIQAQVDLAGGWDAYNGQIIWYSPDVDTYPLTPFDSEAESAEADFRIKRFKLRNISTSFLASYLYKVVGKKDTTAENEIIESLEEFMGDDNASKVMAVFAEREESIPKLEKFDIQDNDKLFEWTSSDTYERIRKVMNIPQALVSDVTAGKLGTARDFVDAVNVFNNFTEGYRNLIQEFDSRILSLWPQPVNGVFEIKPLSAFALNDVPKELYPDMTEEERRRIFLGLGPKEAKTPPAPNPPA